MSENEPLQAEIDRLRPHGRLVWDEIGAGWKMDAVTKELALNVCRTIDRIDRLNRAVNSRKPWFTIAEMAESDDSIRVTVSVDNVLSEIRQQTIALNQMLHKLGVGRLEGAIPKDSAFNATLDAIRGL